MHSVVSSVEYSRAKWLLVIFILACSLGFHARTSQHSVFTKIKPV